MLKGEGCKIKTLITTTNTTTTAATTSIAATTATITTAPNNITKTAKTQIVHAQR